MDHSLALAMRLVNLEAYTGKFDEGIRLEQLLLMGAGFRPVRDIFAAQGPLSLDIFYGPYLTFGQTLGATMMTALFEFEPGDAGPRIGLIVAAGFALGASVVGAINARQA